MYPVSAAFLAAVKSNNRRYYWTGQLTTTAGVTHDITPNDIIKGSGYISGQCCGNSEIELGTVYSTEVGVSLLRKPRYDRYTVKDGELTLTYHLRISTSLDPAEVDPNYDQTLESDGIYEAVPMGFFDITEANWTTKCIEIKAYDRMLRFEKDFGGTDMAGLAYNFVDMCCRACDVTMEQSEQWYFSLPNGSTPLSLYQENDIETFRDVLYYIGQALGGFFVLNRSGNLELRKYGNQPVLLVESMHRFTSSFSDFVTRYTAVSSTNVRTQQSEYYNVLPDNGLTMNLGINPFLQFGVKETREFLCRNILSDLGSVQYVPFESETIGNPALDLGDIIQFSGGQADTTKISAITSNYIGIGGKQKIKCVGKNPLLAQAKSKNDKNIAGLINSIEKGRIAIHTFINAVGYRVLDTDMRIISIKYATTEADKALFFGQIIVDVTADPVSRTASASGTVVIPSVQVDAPEPVDPGDPEVIGNTEAQTISVTLPVAWTDDGHIDVIFTYEMNDTVITLHHPQENWHSGRHTILLYWPIDNVIADYTNTFNVYMRVTGGTADVDVGNCVGSIVGQSLGAAAAWDGTLEFTDRYSRFVFGRTNAGRLRMKTMQESLTYRMYDIIPVSLSDRCTERHGLAAYSKPVDVPGSNSSFNVPYLDEVYAGEDEYV